MSVLAFEPRASRPRGEPGAAAPAKGTFTAPSGLAGEFTGSYRLERLGTEFGQLVAVGVSTGVLCEADGSHVAFGTRRHTAAAEVETDAVQHVVRLGPLDVNVAGFMVKVQDIAVVIRREAAPG